MKLQLMTAAHWPSVRAIYEQGIATGNATFQTGPFGLARHPIYGGGVMAVAGWALFNGAWLGLLAAAGLAVFFDAKARLEERWLSAKFPEYGRYRRRVRKLIPFIY